MHNEEILKKSLQKDFISNHKESKRPPSPLVRFNMSKSAKVMPNGTSEKYYVRSQSTYPTNDHFKQSKIGQEDPDTQMRRWRFERPLTTSSASDDA
jgi:hypothetical protein